MGKSKYSVDFKLKAIKRYHKGDIGTDDLGKRIGVCGSLVRKWIKFYELYGVSGLVRLSNTHYTKDFKLKILSVIEKEKLRLKMEKTLAFGEKNYNYYSAYLRNKYNGQKVYKVIVDAGFTCPNRDGSKGYGGCAYCNTDSFTPVSRNLETFREQISYSMERAAKNYGAEKFIIYFQPNTNTYAPVEELKFLYDEALKINREKIVGLSVGTRPDCIDEEKIALLESYKEQGLEVDLEMGMESIYDETLVEINRGCSHQEFVDAMNLLENSTLDICIHTILGFPNETKEMMLKYVDELNRFSKINFVKFHHLHIVEGSILGVKYKRNPFKLFSIEEYTDLLCEILPKLRPDIVIQRLFGLSDLDMLIAPNWNLKKSQIQNFIDAEIEKRGVIQGSEFR